MQEQGMNIRDVLRRNIESSLSVHEAFLAECQAKLAEAAEALIAAYRRGNKAIFVGNGGSAADAQHLAAEFLGRYLREREPMPALALHANTSAVTAIGNDYGYQFVFSRQLAALGARGDVLVAISTSGNSESILETARQARKMGILSIGLTGESGGRLASLLDILVAVPSRDTPRIQECHILAGHALCDVVEQATIADGLAPASATVSTAN